MTWILTRSGRKFDLARPTADMVDPADIAHSLSMQCRFNGHTSRYYSVAQHSYLVADLVPAEDQLAGLLHDATEAYVGDLVRPLKEGMRTHALQAALCWLREAGEVGANVEELNRHIYLNDFRPEACASKPLINAVESFYHQVERDVWQAICQRFNLDPDLPASVKHADLVALATEKRDLMPHHPEPWPCLDGIDPHPAYIDPWQPSYAAIHYHHRLLQLMATAHRATAA